VRRSLAPILILLLGSTLLDARAVSAQGFSSSVFDTIDTSGHTRLKIFGGLYGSYLAIAVPAAAKASAAGFYAIGLMAGPTIGFMGASAYTSTHSFCEGDAIALSSLTWFGAMQGHLWEAVADLPEDNANPAFGVLGSLAGLVAGISATGAHDFTEGHAASIGAGNWWGMAVGYLTAQARAKETVSSRAPAVYAGDPPERDNQDKDKFRSTAIGGALGLTLGAFIGHKNTHNDIRYLHMGGIIGWLYSSGIVVLQEQDQKGEAITQLAGIGAGLTAGILASKYRPWRSRPGQKLDHSGRMRAQAFSIMYGAYLATVIPMASGLDWWTEETKDRYTLAFMHAPTGLLLGTTYFTRNTNISKATALTVSGLTWFGALQGVLWASANKGTETSDVALISAAGSAGGFLAGTMTARRGLTEAQAAMIGAGNWWGSVLGLLAGSAVIGEDADGEGILAATAMGGVIGALVGPQIGKKMSLRNVRTMHVGGLAGWLFGTGTLLAGGSVGFRGAFAVMGITTAAGLAMGASAGGQMPVDQTDFNFDPKPFVASRPGLSGEKHTVIGFTLNY
jgi:hypothetical protein